MNKIIVFILALSSASLLPAQSAKSILSKYTEATGGQEHWDQAFSMKITGIATLAGQGGMELPFIRIMQKDGKQLTKLVVNGMDYVDTGFDGHIAWGSNSQMQITQKDKDATENARRSKYDFPYPGHNWEQNAYRARYLGEAMVGEVKTFKIELAKRPLWANGEEKENILLMYIDAQRYVPVMTESTVQTGPNAGQKMRSYLSDYREVDGYLYPFLITMKYGEDTFQILEAKTVEWNVEVDPSVFTMPGN